MERHEITAGIHRIAADGYNLFLIDAETPAIINTMPRRAFSQFREKVSEVLDPRRLRYIVVPHHEGDASGALNHWLETAPDAVPVCSEMCTFQNLGDFSDKEPQTVMDGQMIDLGSHRLRFLATPMVIHMDSLMVYEEVTRTLFPNDLFSGLESHPFEDRDCSEEYVEVARAVGYQADDRTALGRTLDKLAALELDRIAPMHGPILTAHLDRYINAFRTNSVAALSERSLLLDT
jgi:flavorubredoxin